MRLSNICLIDQIVVIVKRVVGSSLGRVVVAFLGHFEDVCFVLVGLSEVFGLEN